MDQIVSIFEKEKNIIFNEKRDLILIDSQNLARIESIEELQCLHEVHQGTIEMVIMPENMYEKQFSKFNESETSLKRLLQNPEFTAKIRLEDQKPETMTTLQKFQALWDDRDADYFERNQDSRSTASSRKQFSEKR